LTEFAPMLSFVYGARKFVDVIHPPPNPQVDANENNDGNNA